MLSYRDTILRAARTVDPAIIDIVKNETWKRLKMHGVPLERYLGKGTFGLNKLRAEIESENQGVEIPMEMRWLGRVPDIKQRYKNAEARGGSVTFVVRGQEMADLIIRKGLRVLGKHYQAEAFIEVRPDTICGACSGWGHSEHNCAFPQMPRCALCARQHRTIDHECDTVGCKAPKGAVCVHLIAKCPNCKGPHGARSDSCPKKKEALEKGRNWKGKESMVQKPAPTPTPEHQRVPEPAAPEPDVMERDDGLYDSQHAVQDGGLPSTEREAMEAGLDNFRNGRGFTSLTSLALPASSPPAPPPKYRYAFDQMADLKCHPNGQEKRCHSCLGKAHLGAGQCTGCGRVVKNFDCHHNSRQYHVDWSHLPDPCGRDYTCPNDPAGKELPESRAPTPSPVVISDSDTIMTSDLPRLANEEEL